MKCPLCESTEFQDCGKSVSGDRKYRCEVCQNFFTSRIFNQTLAGQRSKLHLPDINFLNEASDRHPYNQQKNIRIHPLISKLSRCTELFTHLLNADQSFSLFICVINFVQLLIFCQLKTLVNLVLIK